MLKRVLLGVVLVVLVLVIAVGTVLYRSFAGGMPPDEKPLAGGALPILDGFVAAFTVPTEQADKVILIDCGKDKTAAAIKAALAARKQTIAAVFLTHGHWDHVGGCTAAGLGAAAPVYALADEVAIVAGDEGTLGPVAKLLGAHHLGVKVTNPLKDGDAVDILGTTVKVYQTAGHTRGSAVYLARGTAFFGDAAGASDQGEVKAAIWIFSDDTALAARSLRALAGKLQNEKVEQFAFAHTGPTSADLKKLAAVE